MKTFYVIIEYNPPQGKSALGLKIDAEDIAGVYATVKLLSALHEHMIGFPCEMVEVSTKKRRGMEYV